MTEICNVVSEQPVSSLSQEHMERERRAYEERRKGKMRNRKVRAAAAKTIIYAILALYAAVIIFPFLVVITTSLKTYQDATHIPFQWIPAMGFTGVNYKTVFDYNPQMNAEMSSIIQGFVNTLLYIIPPTVIGLFTSSISAYAFSKLRFRAKNVMYAILLGTMMIPGMIMMAPQLSIYDMIGWIDTPLPLMIPGMFGAAACVFFMRQYYVGIPDSIIEYGRLDGLTILQEFWHITLPLIYPTLTTMLVVSVSGFFTSQLSAYNFYGGNAPPGINTLGYYFFVQVVGGASSSVDYPYASAMGLIFTGVAAPVTLLVKYLLERFGPNTEF